MPISPDHCDAYTDQSACARQRIASSSGVPCWIADRAPDIRAPLIVNGQADGPTASRARHEFEAWLAIDIPHGEVFDDLVLAVYETLANAADHAYLDSATGPGSVALLARRSRTALHVTVVDHGTWRPRAAPRHPAAAPAVRGRGLPLIRLLIRDVYIDTGSAGTTVHLRTPLPPPAEHPPHS